MPWSTRQKRPFHRRRSRGQGRKRCNWKQVYSKQGQDAHAKKKSGPTQYLHVGVVVVRLDLFELKVGPSVLFQCLLESFLDVLCSVLGSILGPVDTLIGVGRDGGSACLGRVLGLVQRRASREGLSRSCVVSRLVFLSLWRRRRH